MKTRYGRAIIYSLAFLIPFTLLFTALMVRRAEAATIDNSRLAVPLTSDLGADNGDNLYLIFVDTATAYMADDGTGVTALDTVWLDAAVEGAKQSTTDTGTNTMYAVFDPPPLSKAVEWAMMICENSSPVNTDVPLKVVLYDPVGNKMFSDTNPIRGSHVKTGG